jgi:ribosomal subunit interface protein
VQIVSRGQNVEVSDALVAHCLERATRALRPFSSHISRVQFVFVDLGGIRQGTGHACRVTVELSGGGRVRYEGRAEDYYHAASLSIVGVSRHIQRALERRRVFAAARASTPPPAA